MDLFARGSSGETPERVVYENESLFKSPYAVSPDGRHFLFRQLDPGTRRDIWSVPTAGGEAAPLVRGQGEDWGGAFSPDGRWVVYVSEDSGRPELYVTAFPSGGGKIQITTEGGGFPVWVRDTWEILYSTATGRMMSIPVHPGSPPEFGQPVEQRELTERLRSFRFGSITPDGRRFLGSQAETERQERTMTILAGWEGLLGS
jgi:hypothetical protein